MAGSTNAGTAAVQAGNAPDWNRHDALSLVVLAAVTLVIRGAWFGDPNADIDEQLYSLIGMEMTRGAIPFVDLWDRKPIGLFALFAFAHSVGGPDPIAYHLLAAVSVMTGAALTYRIAMRLADRVSSLGAACLYILLVSIYSSHSAQSEAFHVTMMLGMAILVIETSHRDFGKRALLAMFLGGIALQIKYTVLPQCLFFGVWALWAQYRGGATPATLISRAALYGFLGVLPTMLVGLAYLSMGYLDDFIFANFLSFFDRQPGRFGRFPPDAPIALMPIAGLLLASFYAAVRLSRPTQPRLYMFFVAWLLAIGGTVYLPSTVYQYYYAAFAPAVALLAIPLIDRRSPIGLIPMALAVGGFVYLSAPRTHYEFSAKQRQDIAKLADAIRPHVNSTNNCLWIFDGPTSLYRMSGSCLPTKFIYPDHLNNELERYSIGPSQYSEVVQILANDPPVIVTADLAFTRQNKEVKALVWNTVRRDYEEIATEELHDRQIRVWVRRELLRD